MLALLGTPLAEVIVPTGADVILRNLDFAGAEELADRVAVQTPEGMEKALEGLPKQAQTIVKSLMAQNEQLKQTVQQQALEIKYKANIEGAKLDQKDKQSQREDATRRKDANPNEDANPNAHQDAYTDSDSDRNGNTHTNANGHGILHSNADQDADANGNADFREHGNGNADAGVGYACGGHGAILRGKPGHDARLVPGRGDRRRRHVHRATGNRGIAQP